MNPTLLPYVASEGLSVDQMNPATLAINSPGIITPKTSLDMLTLIEQSGEATNVVLGPSCLWQNAAMLWLGAGGETKRQLEKLYGFNESTFTRYAEMNVIHVANSIWLNQGRVQLLPRYLQRVERELGAMCGEISFAGDQVTNLINGFIAQNTANLIPQMLQPGSITDRDTMALATATAMLEKWKFPFDPYDTYEQPFQTPKGQVMVPMMRRKASFRIAKVNGMQAIEVPMARNGLRAVILMQETGRNHQEALPQVRTTRSLYSADNQPRSAMVPASSALKVTHGDLISLPGHMMRQEVNLVMPKFDISWGSDISEHLKAMGLTVPFTRDADFSGITAANELYMSRVYHKARIKVDEAGVEAAAATVTVMRSKGIDTTPSFVVDRPFVMLICDSQGNVHFIARINNPLA